MEYSAIRHEADKHYCFALEKGRFLFRIQTKRDDIEKVVLHSRDKYIPLERFDSRQETVMEKVALMKMYVVNVMAVELLLQSRGQSLALL